MSNSSIVVNDKPFPDLKAVGMAILFAFIISGACGLIHEVAWTRLLRLVMGNTTYAITTVLCAFMGGLALGSYIGGRIIDKRNDYLLIFAFLEGSIAIYCFFLPWLIHGAEPIYRFLYQNTHTSSYLFSLIRFAFSGMLLLIPATFMGATLPVLTRFFTRSPEHIGWSVGTLYAFNTFGAVLGASAAGFLLIPTLGVIRSIYLACSLNLLVSITSYLLYRRSLEYKREADTPNNTGENLKERKKKSKKKQKTDPIENIPLSYGKNALIALLIGYGFSGFAALVFEIAWTRAISLLIGSTVYAFSMMLTAFVLGLALGSMACAKFVDRVRSPMLVLALIQTGIGLSALMVVPFIGHLPFFVTNMISRFIGSFWMLQLAEFGLVLLIMLVPTFLMGAAFPLANRIFNQGSSHMGRSVGTVYGCNTIGNILGAFMGGFILIPLIGIQNSIFFAVTINIAVGIAFIGVTVDLGSRQKWFAATITALVIIAGIFAIPKWDASIMSFGPFHEAARISRATAQSETALKELAANSKVIFHKEGLSTTVTVKQVTEDVRALYINGKPDASSFSDLPTQEMVAHIPLLLHSDPQNALVIGLASGISLGSAGRHPLNEIDCVEISPAMVEACRYFDEYNYRILDDPRVNLIIADGRNHLALTEKKYDVIISQPSNPYFAGIADLFTREFFELCRKRLADQGVMCTWVQAYHIDLETFQSIIHTFNSVFPDMTFWRTGRSDCILIGTKQDLSVNIAQMVKRMSTEIIIRDLERIDIHNIPEIFAQYVMGPKGIQHFSKGARIHTDDNALVEFSAPRALTRNSYDWELIEAVEDSRDGDLSFLKVFENGDDEGLAVIKEQAKRFAEARGHVFKAHISINLGEKDQAAQELLKAASLNPLDKMLKEFNNANHTKAFYLAKQGQEGKAIALYKDMIDTLPIDERAHYNLATLLTRQEDFSTALYHFQEAVRLKPDYKDALYMVGALSERFDNMAEAVKHYQKVLKLDPDMIPALHNLALLLASNKEQALKDTAEAVLLAERACELMKYQDPYLLETLTIAYAADGRFKDAYDVAKQALELAQKNGNHQMANSMNRRMEQISDRM
jgi:spermidine synthase